MISLFEGQAEGSMNVMVLHRSEPNPNNPQRLVACGSQVPQVDFNLMGNPKH